MARDAPDDEQAGRPFGLFVFRFLQPERELPSVHRCRLSDLAGKG